jgi:hypothetical protein
MRAWKIAFARLQQQPLPSPPAKRTYHLLSQPDISCANDSPQKCTCQYRYLRDTLYKRIIIFGSDSRLHISVIPCPAASAAAFIRPQLLKPKSLLKGDTMRIHEDSSVSQLDCRNTLAVMRGTHRLYSAMPPVLVLLLLVAIPLAAHSYAGTIANCNAAYVTAAATNSNMPYTVVSSSIAVAVVPSPGTVTIGS